MFLLPLYSRVYLLLFDNEKNKYLEIKKMITVIK